MKKENDIIQDIAGYIIGFCLGYILGITVYSLFKMLL